MLFDIDGTLVSGATDAHAEALHDALRNVHGVDTRSTAMPLRPAGRTDGEIARALLLGAGVSAEQIDERADEVRELCCQVYARLCPLDLQHTVLPGVPELLTALSARQDLKLGLLTGNYEAVARLKLRRAGILHHFPPGQGAFGSDSEDRSMLPAIARRRAGTVGSPYPRKKTVVIGDTPRDIACAQADGVRCLAVATGPFLASELDGAEAVVNSATELGSALEPLLSGA